MSIYQRKKEFNLFIICSKIDITCDEAHIIVSLGTDNFYKIILCKVFMILTLIRRGILTILIVTFLVLAFFAKNYPYFSIDLSITRVIQQINLPGFDSIMRFLTDTGEPIPGTIMVIIICTPLFILKRKKEALLTVFSSVGISLIGWVIKTIVARPRPNSPLIHQLEHFVKPDSFPSGHVLLYLGLYGFLLIAVYAKLKKSLFRNALILILSLLIVLIGFSRIYVGAHWFSDVLGSYLVGTLWLFLMIHLYYKHSKTNV